MFNLLPQPCKIVIKNNETVFTLNKETVMNSDEGFTHEFKSFIRSAFRISISQGESKENCILLSLTEDISDEEGYRIVCDHSAVSLTARNNCGLYYGLQTLKQMLLQSGGKLPQFEIEDKPKYAYRAFLLDSGRYYQTVDEIKRLIDLMSFHKFNVFHWHLTEDQGWRIEIKKYPELTKKGQRRSHTNFGFKSEEGFYTQQEVKEIVSYCHERFMKVIPEFDVPGHTVSAIACYPYLSCFDRKLDVATHWGVKHDVLCVGKESTYKFVFDVIDELIELFPDKFIHIGGDEVLTMRWERCEHCQALMKKEGIESEQQLQQLFMNKVNSYVKSKGYTSIMWNYEIIDSAGLIDTDIVWQSCKFKESEDLISAENKKGRKIINSDYYPYYLDFPHAWNSLKRVYEYDPELKDGEIMGVETAIWTEYIPTMKVIEKRTFPRLAAVCENAWGDIKNKNYNEFHAKLDDYLKFLDIYNVSYTSLDTADPSKVKAALQSMWFNRRELHWQGLHNLIDDAIVNSKHKKV